MKKIHSHNQGTAIRGFHSQEWTGTGIPAHPWLVLREANCSKNSRRNGRTHSSTRDSRSGGHHAPGQQHHHHYHHYHSNHHYHQPNHYHSLHHPHHHHIQVCNIFESTFKPQMKAQSNQAKAKGGKVCTCAACQSINCGRWVECF